MPPLERLCAPLARWNPDPKAWGRPKQNGAHAATEVLEWLRDKGAVELADEVAQVLTEDGVFEIETALARLGRKSEETKRRHDDECRALFERHAAEAAAIDAERQRWEDAAIRLADRLAAQDETGVSLAQRAQERGE
jgi:hypothetical protein